MAINNREEKLKCIGGPNDDEWHYIGQADRLGDHVRVEEKQTINSMLQLSPFDLEGHKKAAVINYQIYIIDCFHFSKDCIYYFLRPANLTNKQAVMHQFKKRKNNKNE